MYTGCAFVAMFILSPQGAPHIHKTFFSPLCFHLSLPFISHLRIIVSKVNNPAYDKSATAAGMSSNVPPIEMIARK